MMNSIVRTMLLRVGDDEQVEFYGYINMILDIILDT